MLENNLFNFFEIAVFPNRWASFSSEGKNIKLELGNYLSKKFKLGIKILGERSFSTSIIKLIEKDAKIKLRAKNFPKQLIDKQKKQKGVEV